MNAPLTFPWETPPPPGEAIELAENLLWLRIPMPFRLDHVNSYALWDNDGWTIVDTGIDSEDTRALWRDLMRGPLGGKPVARLIVTHPHPDHIGLAGWFQTEFGVELITTQTAWLYARMLQLDRQLKPVDETLAYWRAGGMDPELYEKRRTERPFNFADLVADLPLGYRRVKEGSTLRFGGRTWDVHIGNGHAPEHATFWSRDDELVIGGDQLLATISPNLGVHATEPDADPVGDWLESCEYLSQFADDHQLVLPGHKLCFMGLPTRMRQLIDNHHFALDRLMEFLDQPRTAAECFKPLFKRKIGEGEYSLALNEAIGHLNHLYRTGKITRRRRASDDAWLWQRKG
ncbi:MBL fold metallo-hydrolase [Maritimibacter fusiformis]|uniref:MBL fold metallo-hydrolase n=1 Tax=Maritimibacter fusiformis TaxID=2603819 RepID=A0A5D0RGE1_9RHOB|nr:MBL fold metallo-hydrolase [Maritimibacter fusiformis]TYB79971.1 MBL fold metallo-hydrolase [Maritimibacter fusiformis]